MSILEVSNLKKIYTTRFGASQVQALSNISFSVEEGEYVAIMGESGSGKTTLLNILAALDQPADGEVILNGKKLQSVREKEIMRLRFGLGGCAEKTQKQVADIMGISQSYISRLEKRILSRLQRDMTQMG